LWGETRSKKKGKIGKMVRVQFSYYERRGRENERGKIFNSDKPLKQ